MKPPAQHMSPDEFRRHGYAVIDRIADYMQQVEDYPVLAPLEPGEVRQMLPPEAPQLGQSFESILADLDRVIMPGITHWQSPDFFAYFPANTSGPSILAEALCAGLGVQGMLWATSPVCTELETHVLDWLVTMLHLPDGFRSDSTGGGVIQDSASSAALCALLAARERVTAGTGNTQGVEVGSLTAYASAQAHSSIEKAVRIAGIGSEYLRLIETKVDYGVCPAALQQAIRRDRAQGRQPFFVCATIGTTSSAAIDPVADIAAVCQEDSLWLHVDAAFAGSAAVCPEFHWLHDGLIGADSYCFNPHKWLLTNFDCDCFYVADRNALIRALSILPEYLKNAASASGQVIDYRDWQVALGRRFRALKLWFVIRYYGITGLQQHIRHHVDLAKVFSTWVEADADFELVTPVSLSLVCFRHVAGDEFNRNLLARLNASGKLYLTHTELSGRWVLRMAIAGTYTQLHHVEAAWQLIQATAQEL